MAKDYRKPVDDEMGRENEAENPKENDQRHSRISQKKKGINFKKKKTHYLSQTLCSVKDKCLELSWIVGSVPGIGS